MRRPGMALVRVPHVVPTLRRLIRADVKIPRLAIFATQLVGELADVACHELLQPAFAAHPHMRKNGDASALIAAKLKRDFEADQIAQRSPAQLVGDRPRA